MRTLPRIPAKALLCYALFATFLCIVLIYGRSRFSGVSQMSVSSTVSRSGSVVKKPKKTYVGNTGQFVFYHLKERNYSVSPEDLAQCVDTRLTQCNPQPRRSDEERARDRARRPPFKLAQLRMPSFMSTDPTFEGCDYDNCKFVGTGGQYARDADAFFVYVVGMHDRQFRPPPGRRPHQTYFMGTWEAPIFTQADFLSNSRSPWNKAFNVSITYRQDSDIVYGYGKLDYQPPLPGKKPDYLQIAKNKTKTAVWIVSNCGSPSKRNAYVKEMKKYIDIDVYGRCGQPCEVFDEICVPNFVSTYRFYLAFENSFCTDYITEKFFKLYIDGSHILPVVRGGVDYNREFPKKTLINSADYANPRDLALFLKRLAANDQEYSSYLEAKDRYRAVTYMDRYCQMCKYLHLNEGKTNVVQDAKKWYGDGHCWNEKVNDV